MLIYWMVEVLTCTYLNLGDKVDIVEGEEDMIHPLVQNIQETFVDLQPAGVEGQAERGLVGGVVPVKVVLQHSSELVLVVDVGAGGHQVTASQVLVKVRVVSSVQLVDGKFPDGVTSAGTVPSVPVALVRHSIEKETQSYFTWWDGWLTLTCTPRCRARWGPD